jgi:DNA-binding CsgD family transcriptional regulator
MKAIANSMEPMGLEPGLFPRAVRPVLGFDFEQLFAVTDISISEDTIGIDAELPATLPLDGQALPLDGQALIETGQMPVGFGVGGLQGADRILGEGAMAQTPPMATASAQENSEKAGAAAPALWLSAIEPQAAWGATDAGLIISSAPELFATKRQVEAHSMALGAVTDAAGQTPVGLGLIGPQVVDRMNLAETAPMAVLSALMLSEGEPQAVLGSKDATLIAPTAPEPLSIKAELEPDEPALDAVLSAASAGDPGVVETAARARPGAEVADIVPLAMPAVERPSFDDAGVAVIEAFAPLIVHAVRLHHTGQAVHQDLSGLLLARLVRRFPALTQRDRDVVAALMQGLATDALAQRLGLTLASAQTYQKRVFRKLGVAGQRELLALLLDGQG